MQDVCTKGILIQMLLMVICVATVLDQRMIVLEDVMPIAANAQVILLAVLNLQILYTI